MFQCLAPHCFGIFYVIYCKLLLESITTESRLSVSQRMMVLLISCPFPHRALCRLEINYLD